MAVTKLADLYDPLVFEAETDEKFIELNSFLQSGVMTPYQKLTDMANVGGMTGETPFFKPLDHANEPDYTNDDDTVLSGTDKITTGKQSYRLAKMHKAWSTMDFARELGLNIMDPLAAITRRIAKWWAIQEEKRLIRSSVGIIAGNVAADAGDMVNDIYADVASPAVTNIISAEAIQDTKQTAGDHQMMFTAMAMHSVTYNTLNKANLIDSQSNINFSTYLGLIVTIDDSLPVVAGVNSPKYTTALFSPGAFGYGNGRAEVPSEMERIAGSGNGGGEDIIHSRRNDIIHPLGFQFTNAVVAAETATLAELETAANWTRVIDRKNVGMAFLQHNN